MNTMAERIIPPGPPDKYDPESSLLNWMMRNLLEYGGIYRASLYGAFAYVLSDPRYVDHVLRENWQNYRKGQAIKRVGFLLGNGLMVSEGELWKVQRRMIQPAFHAETVDKLAGMIQKTSDELLSRWVSLAERNCSINITREVSLWVLEVVLRAIFGEYFDAVAPAFSVLSSESARNLQFAQVFRPLREIVHQVIVQRQQKSDVNLDILGMLMTAKDRGTGEGMPVGQLVSEVVTLIVAGHETTASTLNWVWYLLSEHPDAESNLWNELQQCHEVATMCPPARRPYLSAVIDEAMRLYPPGWLMTRRALKDDQFGNYFVPAGTEIYISPYLIHRNPALWDHPDQFDPGRFICSPQTERHPLAHLPFSAGPRKCIGDLLARLEMQTHIATVVPSLRLTWVSGDPNELDTGVNLRCHNDFHFAATIKIPCRPASSAVYHKA